MRRHPRKAAVDASSPRAWATSDRNGFIGNHVNMQWQYDWAGLQLVNRRILVHADELDVPQRQLGGIILPVDPPPILNARPEGYSIDEVPVTTRVTMDGRIRVLTPYGPPRRSRIIDVAGSLTP